MMSGRELLWIMRYLHLCDMNKNISREYLEYGTFFKIREFHQNMENIFILFFLTRIFLGLNESLVLTFGRIKFKARIKNWHVVGKTLTGYKRGRPLPVLPRIRPRLPRGTQRVTHDGMPRQILTSTRAIKVQCGDMPSQ